MSFEPRAVFMFFVVLSPLVIYMYFALVHPLLWYRRHRKIRKFIDEGTEVITLERIPAGLKGRVALPDKSIRFKANNESKIQMEKGETVIISAVVDHSQIGPGFDVIQPEGYDPSRPKLKPETWYPPEVDVTTQQQA